MGKKSLVGEMAFEISSHLTISAASEQAGRPKRSTPPWGLSQGAQGCGESLPLHVTGIAILPALDTLASIQLACGEQDT